MSLATTLNIEVDTVREFSVVRSILHESCSTDVPIELSSTEGTAVGRTTEEDVPDVVGELLRLSVGTERRVRASTTEGDESDLALRLAALNSGREELAVREVGAREGAVVPVCAGLQGDEGLLWQCRRMDAAELDVRP